MNPGIQCASKIKTLNAKRNKEAHRIEKCMNLSK
jgi:hypothetical protein